MQPQPPSTQSVISSKYLFTNLNSYSEKNLLFQLALPKKHCRYKSRKLLSKIFGWISCRVTFSLCFWPYFTCIPGIHLGLILVIWCEIYLCGQMLTTVITMYHNLYHYLLHNKNAYWFESFHHIVEIGQMNSTFFVCISYDFLTSTVLWLPSVKVVHCTMTGRPPVHMIAVT